MKIYVYDHGVMIAGKAWEVRGKLKECGKDYTLVSDWIHNHKKKDTASGPAGVQTNAKK